MPHLPAAVEDAANLPKQTERFWAGYIHQYPSTNCLRRVDGHLAACSVHPVDLLDCSLHVRYSGFVYTDDTTLFRAVG